MFRGIMVSKRYVSYLRVSTPKQGENGLGVEAQREAVRRYLLSHHGEQIAEFVEVESGKRSDRPQLAAAMALAKKRKATLLVAKLDRLSRSVAFIATLMDSKGFDLAIADMPGANRLTLHVLAAAAEHERHMIGERTRHALAAAKARGIKPVGRTVDGTLPLAGKRHHLALELIEPAAMQHTLLFV